LKSHNQLPVNLRKEIKQKPHLLFSNLILNLSRPIAAAPTSTQQPRQSQPARLSSGIPVRQSSRVLQEVDRFKPKDFRKLKYPNGS